ncbi:TetR/AcrR family transcriptional regulator [Paraburkholderia sediminicola]|uniref:TetR/AcrR family transcriptional regulator n=1 Tax=Paraburkholderia sediminicola TaxID=458836 RepID=UPI0038BB0834
MPRIASEAKREQLLDIASKRFLARGFAAVSVDEIVAAANQSKTNVYSYFGGKEGLFLATVDRLLADILFPLEGNDFASLPIEQGLYELANAILSVVLGKSALALHRLIVAEAASFPEIARRWFEAGPERAYGFCADFIAAHQKGGRLRTADTRRAAVFLHDMLIGDYERRMLTGVRGTPKPRERDALILSAIDLFLNGYGGESSQ